MAKPDALNEALTGLMVLARDRITKEHPRLIKQFRNNYPEIRVVDPDLVRKLWSVHAALCKHHCNHAPKLHVDGCVDMRDGLKTLGSPATRTNPLPPDSEVAP